MNVKEMIRIDQKKKKVTQEIKPPKLLCCTFKAVLKVLISIIPNSSKSENGFFRLKTDISNVPQQNLFRFTAYPLKLGFFNKLFSFLILINTK